MRILFWSELYFPAIGGVEVLLNLLTQGLRKRGHECALVTNRIASEHPGREVRDGLTIHRLDLRAAWVKRDLRELRRVFNQLAEIRASFNPTAEHVYLGGSALSIQQMTNHNPRRRTLVNVQSPPEELLRAPELGTALASVPGPIVSVTETLRSSLVTAIPALAHKIIVIPNAIPLPSVDPAPLPWNPPTLLLLGRLVRVKGFDVALRAFAELQASRVDFRAVIAGDGPEREPLERLSTELGLIACVKFLGWVKTEDVPEWMNRATLLIVPSRGADASPLVLLQAAQLGRPVVAARMGGIPEVLGASDTGLMVPNEDPPALAGAIRTLLANPARSEAMGAAARRRALDELSFDRFLDRHEEVYDEGGQALIH